MPKITTHRGRTYVDDYVVMVSARPSSSRVGGDMVTVTPAEYHLVVERDPKFLEGLSRDIKDFQARKAAG